MVYILQSSFNVLFWYILVNLKVPIPNPLSVKRETLISLVKTQKKIQYGRQNQ